jgi:hypothetical protein
MISGELYFVLLGGVIAALIAIVIWDLRKNPPQGRDHK